MLARKFSRRNAVCSICNVPQAWLDRLAAEDRVPAGGYYNWSRLAIDHVDPTDRTGPENLRLLCYHCNRTRGRGRRTDQNVHQEAWKFWRFWFKDKDLPWLVSYSV